MISKQAVIASPIEIGRGNPIGFLKWIAFSVLKRPHRNDNRGLSVFLLITILSLSLSSCSFRPLLSNDIQCEFLPEVKVTIYHPENSPLKVGFFLEDYLSKRIGKNCEHMYNLVINYNVFTSTYAIQGFNTFATREKVLLTVDYALYNCHGEAIDCGTIKRSGSFNIEDSTFSTYATQEYVASDLAYPAAEQILLNISKVFKQCS